ncbi:MAG: DUF1804 family protein [Methylotenera sp.]
MAHPQETKDNVRKLYIEGLPLNGAAISFGVSYDTARDWKQKAKDVGDNWDTARAAFQISTQGIDSLNTQLVEKFARQALITMRKLEDSPEIPPAVQTELMAQLADAYAKFSKAFSRVNPRLSALSVGLDTLKITADYLAKHDKAALRIFQEHIEPIGAIIQERYST